MITTVRNLSLRGRGSSWLSVSWSLPCSERGGAVVGYNVTWCEGEGGSCEGAVVETTSHNITNLTPWRSYTITLTVITMGLTGGTTDPITLQTLPSVPASPPRNLNVVEATNTTANVSWDTPMLSNGPISSYRVSLSQSVLCLKFAVKMRYQISSKKAKYEQKEPTIFLKSFYCLPEYGHPPGQIVQRKDLK